ncbi:MAG: hypothetical protein WBN83_07935 [Desulfoprunum sp.]|uniref:hypothetical protein n=1 Tax=Desulfoprunum sp. TaxID=2020866 RepID=UPI003C75A210
MTDIQISQKATDSSELESRKQVWTTPTLRMLNISETNGAPGAPQGDGDAPYTARPKVS